MAMYPCLTLPPLSFPTLTGSIVTFNSQYAGLPLKSHKIALTATQSGSGTPSPQNIRSINGYSEIKISATGKNLINWEHLNLHGWGGSDSELVAQFNNLKEGDYAIQFKIKVITLQSGYDTGNYGLLIRAVNNGVNFNITMRADKTDVSEGDIFTYTATFTLTSEYVGKFTSAYYYTGRSPSNNSDYCDFYDFQVEKGSIVTDYEPFGTTATIQIGSTVYGGEYDARTGVLTVTHKGILARDVSGWMKSDSVFYRNFPDVWTAITPDTPTGRKPLSCSHFDYSSSSIVADLKVGYGGANNNGNIVIRYDALSTISDFNDYIANNDVFIVYPLATPTTIQLPPCPIDTLEGVNNIWADTGDTTLQYPKFG